MLTPSQHRALASDVHLSITANAGSGKTLVLVERYISILLAAKARVPEVVAITFTEKAAGELRRKVADRIAVMLRETDDSGTRLALEGIRDELSTAVIGTIHAFCARVLREYPVEAGIDASFLVLEGVDQQLLLEEAKKETFEALLKRDGAGALREGLVILLREFGKSRVVHILDTLLRKREAFLRLTENGGLYTRSDDEILKQWNAAAVETVRFEIAGGGILGDIHHVMAQATGPVAVDVTAEVATLEKARDVSEQARLLAGILGRMLTAGGKISRKLSGTGRPDKMRVRRLADRWKSLKPVLEFVGGNADTSGHHRLLGWSRCLLEIAGLVLDRYQQRKLDAGQLDFDDLQIGMRSLLQDEVVRSRLMSRYKYIMVDEYQDTNSVQYEILLPLLGNLSTGNLCIVGDPKQSIYGFRNADVAVFDRTCKDIVRHSGGRGEVILGESFRPLGDIAAFVNLLFSPLMQRNSGSEFDVAYDPLVKARSNPERGRVELILRNGESDEPGEAELIARRIRQLHHSMHQVFDKDEHGRSVQWRDVAVLLRSRVALEEFEEAFIRHQIPYVVAGGVGYFQTQNILDFYNYFRFLLYPHDDIALVGVLRSPFFAVSDAELFEAISGERKGSVWQYLTGARGALAMWPALERAVQMLAEDQTVGLRLGVSDVLERIVKRTNYAAISAGIPRGTQGMANLRKLQKLARTHDQRGLGNLYDFTLRLKRLIDEEEQEGQGVVDARGDAVQIMTVHAAKGLEFPVVIVPGLERQFRADSEPFVDEALGIGFSADGESVRVPPITMVLKHRSTLRTVAEEKRVFYVACTRARDILVLSGCMNAPHASWMHWFSSFVGLPQSDASCLDHGVRLGVLEMSEGESDVKEQDYKLEVHILRPSHLLLTGPPEEKAGGTLVHQMPTPFIQDISRQAKGEIFSASRIRTYLECPSLYYLRHVLGLPEGRQFRLTTREESPDREMKLQATERGVVIHSAMERIDTSTEDGIQDLVRSAMRVNLFPVEELSGEVLLLAEAIRNITISDFWKKEVSGTEIRTEYSITAAVGEDFLTGTIDRMYRSTTGALTTLDYKTDDIPVEMIKDRAEIYITQIRIYAWLASKLHSNTPVRGVLLFTNHPDKPVICEFDKRALAMVEEECLGVMANIKSLKFNTLAAQCPSCPFRPHQCPVVLPQ